MQICPVFARSVTNNLSICDCLREKTHIVCTKTEFNLIATVDRHTIYPSQVYKVVNINWSTFLKGILPTLQSHGWNNGTHGGCQLGSGDLGLLPLTTWPTGVSLASVWASRLLIWCPKQWFLPPPTSLHPPHPTPPTPSIISTDGRKGRQKIS